MEAINTMGIIKGRWMETDQMELANLPFKEVLEKFLSEFRVNGKRVN